jgi:hypothetical protein
MHNICVIIHVYGYMFWSARPVLFNRWYTEGHLVVREDTELLFISKFDF